MSQNSGDRKKTIATHITHTLTSSSSILGLKLYILLLIGIALLLFSCFLLFCLLRRRNNRDGVVSSHHSGVIQLASKVVQSPNEELGFKKKNVGVLLKGDAIGVLVGGKGKSGSELSSSDGSSSGGGDGANIGWGRWYSLRELEMATRGFSDENVVGEGGYGVVYRGELEDGSVVAIKKLLNNKGQAEREFKVEVEAIGKVRHKNLVGLIGYCAEGSQRMLVYEYVDNGNLEQWLHGEIRGVNPLTWDIRVKIAIGTAKGLAYLHEGLEPKVVHRDVKSSNILLDKNWNAKVSDFGLAKLLGSGASYVTTRVMGTFGYVSPEYASTGKLCEESDVYSFGVLLMELITGRSPVDYTKPPGEVNLVEWFKGLVGSKRGEDALDPKILVPPCSRALKRVLLICLRCIDLDSKQRPKMGQIVHMLEAEELPFRSSDRRLPADFASTMINTLYLSVR